MQTLGVVTGIGVCNSGATLMARVLGNAGTPITQASMSAITYTVRNITLREIVAQDTALTVSAVVFDSLQTEDPRWDLDATGYNFLTVIPATAFASFTVNADTSIVTPHRYQVDVEFTPTSGQKFIQAFQFLGVPTYAT